MEGCISGYLCLQLDGVVRDGDVAQHGQFIVPHEVGVFRAGVSAGLEPLLPTR